MTIPTAQPEVEHAAFPLTAARAVDALVVVSNRAESVERWRRLLEPGILTVQVHGEVNESETGEGDGEEREGVMRVGVAGNGEVDAGHVAAALRGRGVVRPLVIVEERGLGGCVAWLHKAAVVFDGRGVNWLEAGLEESFVRQVDVALLRDDRGARALADRTELGERVVWCGDEDGAAVREAVLSARRSAAGRRGAYRVLMLYDANFIHINTVREFLDAFGEYSSHEFWYAHATGDAVLNVDLAWFDAVILHYSVRLPFPGFFSKRIEQMLREYGGFKALFIQDEYDHTNLTKARIRDLGFQTVFTCVPRRAVEKVYPSEEFPAVRFEEVLTGYVPLWLEQIRCAKPLRERKVMIGYRGRELPFWYGALAREKYAIGVRMKEECARRGVAADIEWEESKRIYGDGWYEFLGSVRATLGTESGSRLFDWDGAVRRKTEELLEAEPTIGFEEAHQRLLHEFDDAVDMNQVSPKIFESIALRTALVLFEGTYSGVVRPWTHFLPLKKDYSNLDEILEFLKDDERVEAMTRRAYEDVVLSGRYSYRSFVKRVDAVLESEIGAGRGTRLVTGVLGAADASGVRIASEGTTAWSMPASRVTELHLKRPAAINLQSAIEHARAVGPARMVWGGMPEPVKVVFRPPLRAVRAVVRRLRRG